MQLLDLLKVFAVINLATPLFSVHAARPAVRNGKRISASRTTVVEKIWQAGEISRWLNLLKSQDEQEIRSGFFFFSLDSGPLFLFG